MGIIYGIVILVVILLLAAQFGLLSGKQPNNIGVTSEQLKPPSKTRNSVSSQAHLYADHVQLQYASIEPLPFKNNNAANSMQVLVSVLKSTPGMTIVDAKPDYIYAHAKTKVLKFVDDVEFWVNPAKGVIEVRSASRLGREDFGVNRVRVEAIRAAYLAN
ncbi:MAG: DUF1499 domain-containing protein [Burkholderiaceae bacterium]